MDGDGDSLRVSRWGRRGRWGLTPLEVARVAGADTTGELERMLTAALRHSGRDQVSAVEGAEGHGVDEIWDACDDWEDIPSPLLAATPPSTNIMRSTSEEERARTLRELDGCEDVWDAAEDGDDQVIDGMAVAVATVVSSDADAFDV